MDTEEEKVLIKYSSYTPAQKRATQKYRQNNKEKVNEQRKKYYQERKEKDPDFLMYKREKAREYYQRKKAAKDTPVEDTPVEDIADVIVQDTKEPEKEVVMEVLVGLPEQKPKPKRKKTKGCC